MTGWSEDDEALFRRIAPIAVPRRVEMLATLLAALPSAPTTRSGSLSSAQGKDCSP
jgi:hypothetical protein